MAGRPRTPIGTWGDISAWQTAAGTWQAKARFRATDGRTVAVSARGKSESAAKAALRRRLAQKSKEAAPAAGINSTTTVADLCKQWIDGKLANDEVRPQTVDDYRRSLDRDIRPRIGEVTLAEASSGRISRFLDGLTPGSRKRARTILAQSFALALSHDAVTSNPVKSLPQQRSRQNEVRVLDPEEMVALLDGVRQWMDCKINDDGTLMKKPRGRSRGRAHGLMHFIQLLLATGCRPGELAAVRWCDIDLAAETPTMLIDATMVVIKGKGLVRQPMTKTGKGRSLTLPPFAVQVLATMRQEQMTPIGVAPLFPSEVNGGHRDPSNIASQWRRARKAAGLGEPERFSWVEFRTMRRTVATAIDESAGDTEAAAQLGHASTGITRKHYIRARAAEAPDLTEILQTRFAGSG